MKAFTFERAGTPAEELCPASVSPEQVRLFEQSATQMDPAKRGDLLAKASELRPTLNGKPRSEDLGWRWGQARGCAVHTTVREANEEIRGVEVTAVLVHP